MRYRGPLDRETWNRLVEAAREMCRKRDMKRGEEYRKEQPTNNWDLWFRPVSFAGENFPFATNRCGYDFDAVAELVGCCSLSARIWRQRAYEGRPVYPSQFIAKISDILQEPLASDFDLFAKMANDPANWFKLKAEALTTAKEAMAKGEGDRLEVERKAEEARLKADANAKMQELLRQAEAQAKAAGITLTVNVTPVAA